MTMDVCSGDHRVLPMVNQQVSFAPHTTDDDCSRNAIKIANLIPKAMPLCFVACPVIAQRFNVPVT